MPKSGNRAVACTSTRETSAGGRMSESLFQRFDSELPPLRGVVHAAGLVDDALLDKQSWDRFAGVMGAPRSWERNCWTKFTAETRLDFFVLYSSAASILGNPGQGNYATANAFLDGLAWQRRAEGRARAPA